MPISTVWILKYVQQCYVKRFWTISSLGAPDNGILHFHCWISRKALNVSAQVLRSSQSCRHSPVERALLSAWLAHNIFSLTACTAVCTAFWLVGDFTTEISSERCCGWDALADPTGRLTTERKNRNDHRVEPFNASKALKSLSWK